MEPNRSVRAALPPGWPAAALLVAALLLGASVRAVGVWRPADGTSRFAGREADVAAVARNFHREGLNPLYPRIDWRGDGPGYAEMEAPLLPWLAALLYRIAGVRDELTRALSYAFSLLGLAAFCALVRHLLPPLAAAAATLAYALSPRPVALATSPQPETAMAAFLLAGVLGFLRWVERGHRRDFTLGAAGIAAAILCKAVAAHVGLLLAAVLLRERGLAAVRSPRVWGFALCAVLPGIAWYAHAHGLWLRYGNSLGVSNEWHWLGLDLLRPPYPIAGMLQRSADTEIYAVWMPAGLFLAALGAAAWRDAPRTVSTALFWALAVGAFHLAAIRTTGTFGLYYHVLRAAPAALLVGAGLEAARRRWLRDAHFVAALALASAGAAVWLALAAAGRAAPAAAAGSALLSPSKWILLATSPIVAACAVAVARSRPRAADARPVLASAACALLALHLYASQAARVAADLHPAPLVDTFACARALASRIPADARIVVTGHHCLGSTGRPTAYDIAYLFYWIDRKGFSLCREAQSVAALEERAARGAAFFVAEGFATDAAPGFEAAARARFPLVAECGELRMLDLGSSRGAASGL
jgi:4-amino-4-deoxy-L-arabinose transferase-like glycosyltransferase